eukprot:scaffold2246_cov105-Isochrysis_galbana.AAC.1
MSPAWMDRRLARTLARRHTINVPRRARRLPARAPACHLPSTFILSPRTDWSPLTALSLLPCPCLLALCALPPVYCIEKRRPSPLAS